MVDEAALTVQLNNRSFARVPLLALYQEQLLY